MLLPFWNNLAIPGPNPYAGRFRPEISTSSGVIALCGESAGLVTDNGGLDPQPDPTLLFKPEIPQIPVSPKVRVVLVTDNAGVEPQPDPPRLFRPDRR